MGEVYLVEDTKLDRTVALKVLPGEVVSDPERRARLTREAKVLAGLNHPNIVHVYSVEEADGVHFITMELVRGKSLADLLPKNGFPLARFFEIVIPLADALAAAHQQRITHRDLKPANVMVADDGRVKVLDFGIAIDQRDAVSDNSVATRTLDDARVVGTPAYMSPEQAEGKAVDARSDIFSLGILLYEMVTGQRPFSGGTTSATLLSIVSDTPRSVIELQPRVPRELARVVHRCLAKDPIRRYQSSIDLRNDLEEVKQQLDSGEVAAVAGAPHARSRITSSRWIWLVAALTVAAGAYWLTIRPERAGPSVRLHNPRQLTSAVGVENYPTWAPDGTRLAYQSMDLYSRPLSPSHIWVAQVGRGEPVNLTRDHPGVNRSPSWSPDGREIAFFSDRGGVWGVYLVPAIGGTPRSVLALPELSTETEGSWSTPQWSRDGALLLVSIRQGGENVAILLSLPGLTTTRTVLPGSEANRVFDLALRPDGGRYAYTEGNNVASEVTRLWTIAAAGGEGVPLTDGRSLVWSPSWSDDGRMLFYVSNRGGTMDLWQQPLADDGTPLGEPLALTQGLGIRSAVFSPDGTKLAYARGGPVSNLWRVPILSDRPAVWADATQVTSEQAYIEFLDISPDGQRLAVSSDRRGNQDLWLLPASGGDMTQLTTDPAPDWNPQWSPDDREIAFYSYRSGNRDVWVMPSAGGPARQLTSHPAEDWFPAWSPDGREIAFHSRRDEAIWIVSAQGGEPRRLTAANTSFGWAPDGESLVIVRGGSVYEVSKAGGEPVLIGPGGTPRFSSDGQSMYYNVSTGPPENRGLWSRSIANGGVRQLTQLEGRRGRLGNFTADARHLYFTWREDVGDIWVMDVAKGQ